MPSMRERNSLIEWIPYNNISHTPILRDAQIKKVNLPKMLFLLKKPICSLELNNFGYANLKGQTPYGEFALWLT